MKPEQPPLKPVSDRRSRPADRRRSFRTELPVPVTVRWKTNGSTREETTKTRVINSHGCLVLLKAPIAAGQSVELVNLETKDKASGRVVWSGAVEPDGRAQVGIDLENPNPEFWGKRYTEFLRWATMPHE